MRTGGGDVADGLLARALAGATLADRMEVRAAERLLTPVRAMKSEFRVGAMVVADLALSRLWSVDGNFDAAAAVIEELLALIRARPTRSGMLDHVRSQQARVHLAVGSIETAVTLCDAIDAPDLRGVLAARIALASRDPGRAREAITDLDDVTTRTRRHLLAIALLEVRLAILSGEPADEHAINALEIAAAERMLLPLVEEGGEALRAVQAMARKRSRDERIEAILKLRPPVIAHPGRPPLDADALTRREQVILRHMATSMTYREIADELFVSLNTVKTHVRHINRKLDTTSRHEAVQQAHALHYL